MNLIENILIDNIEKPDSLFIFPTDTAASRWADHLLRLKGGTVAMNKFTAWDKFKQNSIKSKVPDKSSIPSSLRKIFVSRLIWENGESVREINAQRADREPLFTSLIRVRWAENAFHFTSWLTGLLPQLASWFKKNTGLSIDMVQSEAAQKASLKFDDDEKDMLTLARRYAQFLNKHNLFEPAWEEPPFNNDGKECFLFFPESLSDFGEYKDLLSSSGHVRLISIKETAVPEYDAFYYTNARREITEASLYIRSLHEKKGIEWDSIAVCTAESEGYESYLIREFENRNIPYVKRISKPLGDFPAGRFFSSILECVSQNFSFSSLAALVTNKNLPWNNVSLIDKLIKFGIENNCLYSWNEKKDGKEYQVNVWDDAFKNPLGGIDPSCYLIYNKLKTRLVSLRTVNTFSELRRQYFIFRETFFDMNNCGEETDIVLSRCVSELMQLVELENNFPHAAALDPFSFFVEHLSETNYLAQAKTSGINILPYKTAAASPFDCHIILGAGHKSLSIIFKKLDFLPGNKRKMLNIFDEDASFAYINMHKYNSLKRAAFFCSEQSFGGYSIPHSGIGAPSKPKETYLLSDQKPDINFSLDYYMKEFSSFDRDDFTLHENQKTGFEKWIKRRELIKRQNKNNNANKLNDFIQKALIFKQRKNLPSLELSGKYSVSASALKKYYQCSVNWLFDYILGLDNVQTETNLMSENISGMVYHSVLERFFSGYKKKSLPKPVITDQGAALPEDCGLFLQECINTVFDGFKTIPVSPLSARFLYAQKEIYYFNLEKSLVNFISLFCGATVLSCEKWYQAPRGNFFLNGKLDCVLKDANGKNIIVDFKMAALPRRNECVFNEETEPRDFQLPMYITLAEENENTEIAATLFYSILKLKTEVITGRVYDYVSDNYYPKKEEDCIIRDDEAYNQLFKIFNDKVQSFADEIISGNFSVYESDAKICLECRFNSICRKVYSIKNEKNISLRKI